MNDILIYNSLTRRKEALRPLVPGRLRLYVCGMTVYDYCHLGHARVMVAFDVAVRYLRSRGLQVTYVRNITDIDDKILHRAQASGEDWRALTERFIAAMREDAAALGVLPPDHEPRATAHIPQITAMIQALLARGHAYLGSNGDVYYDVSSFPAYGRLSGKQLSELRAGARVAVEEAKDDPLDFVLWKRAKPGEPSWDSPWGPGRPGWHIECSAMSTHCLGDHFDIHGGGMDLQFPHHDNEIAQSVGATGQPFVNLWMHIGFVRVHEEKMSKSLGNFFTVREVLAHHPAEAVRYFLLSGHYRSPLNYTEQHLHEAHQALTRLYTALRDVPASGDAAAMAEDAAFPAAEASARFHAAMSDDFNTPEALAALFDLARDLNRAKEAGRTQAAVALAAELRRLGGVLGLLQQPPAAFLRGPATAPDVARIEALVARRHAARMQRDFRTADAVRDELRALGVELEDGPAGTTWRKR